MKIVIFFKLIALVVVGIFMFYEMHKQNKLLEAENSRKKETNEQDASFVQNTQPKSAPLPTEAELRMQKNFEQAQEDIKFLVGLEYPGARWEIGQLNVGRALMLGTSITVRILTAQNKLETRNAVIRGGKVIGFEEKPEDICKEMEAGTYIPLEELYNSQIEEKMEKERKERKAKKKKKKKKASKKVQASGNNETPAADAPDEKEHSSDKKENAGSSTPVPQEPNGGEDTVENPQVVEKEHCSPATSKEQPSGGSDKHESEDVEAIAERWFREHYAKMEAMRMEVLKDLGETSPQIQIPSSMLPKDTAVLEVIKEKLVIEWGYTMSGYNDAGIVVAI